MRRYEDCDLDEVMTQLSRLLEAAARGELVHVAKAGKPLVKVIAVEARAAPKRMDFMKGQFTSLTTSTRWTEEIRAFLGDE